MVKLDDDDFEEEEEFSPKTKFVSSGDYRGRRILVWVVDPEIRSVTESVLMTLLPLATIRVADSEQKCLEFFEKEEWDAFVVDLTEEGVSDSDFIKRVNNRLDSNLIAIHYPQLTQKGEHAILILESIRRLFDESEAPKPETEKYEDVE